MSQWLLMVLMSISVACLPGSPAIDWEANPWPYVTTSSNGKCYFKMVPVGDDGGSGTAFSVRVAADDQLWSVSGWWSPAVFLSNNGQTLVRIGKWPQGTEPSAEHLAIAFYHEGALLKQYSTMELIKDSSVIPRSSSHYRFWIHEAPNGFTPVTSTDETDSGFFQFITSDKLVYVFDIRNGDIARVSQYSE